MPSSVEEIWLEKVYDNNLPWDDLLCTTPRLKVLKLSSKFLNELSGQNFQWKPFLGALKMRDRQVRIEEQVIDGIKMASLEKVVLSKDVISNRVVKLMRKTVDIRDIIVDLEQYPTTVEISI